jgi:carbon monoxide dehydrogenase subunit G
MEIKSTEVTIQANAEQVFAFLLDMQNIYHLLPQDKVTEWTADSQACSFKVQQAATISLVQQENTPHATIRMVSGAKTPFPFSLTLRIQAIDENTCTGYLHFDGQVNTFLKMMVEKPLTNLFNYMSEKLKTRFES